MDVTEALQNTVQQLQKHPARYKAFGVYWWAVKRLLKGAGYGRHQLYMLGNYEDAEQVRLIPPGGLEETLRSAFEAYGQNVAFPHTGGRVESPDGELVMIYDEDAGR